MSSDEERITQLERHVATLRVNFEAYGREHQRILGESQAYEQAVMALLDLFPDKQALWSRLSHRVAQAEADCVARSEVDERLQGLQAVQQLLTDVYQMPPPPGSA